MKNFARLAQANANRYARVESATHCLICNEIVSSFHIINLENIDYSKGSKQLRIAINKKIDIRDKANFIYDKGTAFMGKGRTLKEFIGFGEKGYKCLQICQDCAVDVLTTQHIAHKLLRGSRTAHFSPVGEGSVPSTRETELKENPPSTPALVLHRTEQEGMTNHISTPLHHFVNELRTQIINLQRR